MLLPPDTIVPPCWAWWGRGGGGAGTQARRLAFLRSVGAFFIEQEHGVTHESPAPEHAATATALCWLRARKRGGPARHDGNLQSSATR